MTKIIIHQGDNRLILKEFPDASFDSCVCDPPYELGFMGKAWDKSGIAYDVAMWKDVYRVLKPGAHLLAFGGSRTYHRLACAIEDAGFEIRDQIMWLYGSGFPKSLDVSKAIDKAAGEYLPGAVLPSTRKTGASATGIATSFREKTATNPQTPLARQWDGWGTALKPAHEPIVLARKPLEGTVVQNVLEWGCGGLNVAGCRIECADGKPVFVNGIERVRQRSSFDTGGSNRTGEITYVGRWPANVIHDGSDEVLAEFAKYGKRPVSGAAKLRGGNYNQKGSPGGMFGGLSGGNPAVWPNDFGTAARFFYCAKASPKERGKDNRHPTVKPLSLMAYLVRLVTPPDGIVLDPFMGSGSTLIAAAEEGFDAVGIDLEIGSCEIAAARCKGHLGMLAEVEDGFGS